MRAHRIPRMTTRRWIIAVAVVATFLGIRSGVERQREMYRQRAAGLDRDVLIAQVNLLEAKNPGTGCVDVHILLHSLDHREAARVSVEEAADRHVALEGYRRRARHYERLRDKYQRAVRYPWLPVWPDRPLPEL